MNRTPKTMICGPMRYVLMAFGIVCTGVGIAGILLPGIPGTVFLLIAVWAFSRSSERFHVWLYTHPRFGQGIRHWHEYRVIPVRAKIAAVTMIAGSFLILYGFVFERWETAAGTGAVMALVALWIATRPSRVKLEDAA